MRALSIAAALALGSASAAAAAPPVTRHSAPLVRREPIVLGDADAGRLGLSPPHRTQNGALHRVSRAAGYALHINGGWQLLGAYFADIAVGGKNFRVLVDTGSSNLLLGAEGCSTCGKGSNLYHATSPMKCTDERCGVCNVSPGCKGCAFQSPFCAVDPAGNHTLGSSGSKRAGARFTRPEPGTEQERMMMAMMSSTSSSSEDDGSDIYCGAGITYGGGGSAVSGFLADDTVCGFGPVCVNSSLTAVTVESPSSSLSSDVTGGLIGLAYEFNACNPTCTPPVFDLVVKNSGISDEFAICLTPTSGGRIDFGFVNETTGSGPFVYTAITHEHWYNMEVLAIGVQDQYVVVDPVLFAVTNDIIGTFCDSGTSVVLFGPQIFAALETTLRTFCGTAKGLCELLTNNCVDSSSVDVSTFPTIFVEVPEESTGKPVRLLLPPAAYASSAGNNGQTCLLIAPTPSVGIVLGDTFMQNYYIHHDRKNKRIGFSPLAECA